MTDGEEGSVFLENAFSPLHLFLLSETATTSTNPAGHPTGAAVVVDDDGKERAEKREGVALRRKWEIFGKQ